MNPVAKHFRDRKSNITEFTEMKYQIYETTIIIFLIHVIKNK